MPIDGGIGGSIAPIATAPQERSGWNVRPRSGVQRNFMRTSEEKRNDPIKTLYAKACLFVFLYKIVIHFLCVIDSISTQKDTWLLSIRAVVNIQGQPNAII